MYNVYSEDWAIEERSTRGLNFKPVLWRIYYLSNVGKVVKCDYNIFDNGHM